MGDGIFETADCLGDQGEVAKSQRERAGETRRKEVGVEWKSWVQGRGSGMVGPGNLGVGLVVSISPQSIWMLK